LDALDRGLEIGGRILPGDDQFGELEHIWTSVATAKSMAGSRLPKPTMAIYAGM
jgi:hypothetical protein